MPCRGKLLPRLLAFLLSAALLTGTGVLAAEETQAVSYAAIYTTSNMRGRLYDQDPLTGSAVEESYLKVSTIMARERVQMADTLLLDAGNAVSTGLIGDDGQAVAAALRSIGYDGLVPGLEEFRLGAGYCQAFLQALAAEDGAGTPVDVLSANLLDSRQSPLADPYQVYELNLGGSTLRVGVLGLGGIDAARQLPERLYGDTLFAHGDNSDLSYLWEWNYWQPQLAQAKCDLVVVVCHAGREELEKLAGSSSGIDLFIGGDGPAETGTLPNAEGEEVPYACGGGTALTRTLIKLDGDGQPAIVDNTVLDLSDWESDGDLARSLADCYTAASQAGLRQVGTLSGPWEESFSLTRQTDTTDLVGEALLWASGGDAALVTPGALGGFPVASLFERNKTTAALTLSDCAKLAPEDSPVLLVELTGTQLRQWLEVCAGRYTVTDGGQCGGGVDADVLYGANYELYLGSPVGQRVGTLFLGNGPVTNSQVYRVAVSAAHLADPEFPQCQVLWSAAADRDFASQGGSTAALLAAYAQNAAHESRALTPTRSGTWAIYPEAVNGALTRLEFVELLYDLAGRPQPGANYAFIDVSNSNAVIWAAETRVVSGDGRGNFLPLSAVTREQAAVMLYNYVRSLGGAASSGEHLELLLDGAEISAWARPAVEFCLTTGILPATGTREDLYLPSSSVTRSQAVQYLANLAAYLG